MKHVYPFTNENLSSYQNLYDFNNSKVLSVLGSGDQYFSSLLYGAKEIELYDCNFIAWDFFVLKFYGILILSYEEFYDFFVVKRLNDLKCLKKLLTYLPHDVAKRLTKMQKRYRLLSRTLFEDVVENKYNNDSLIPYFNKQKYYQLQSILRNQQLPKFYLTKLQSLPSVVEKKSYDIILTSNIFDWIYDDLKDEFANICVKEYKTLLNKFHYSEIQALYAWSLSANLQKALENNDFEIEKVPAVKTLGLSQNSVVSLRKK